MRSCIVKSISQSSPPWGLDRVDSCSPVCTEPRLDQSYSWGSADGAGVNVYVLDTGVRTSHGDFGGRAHAGWSARCQSGYESACSTNGGQWAYQGVITNAVNSQVGGSCNDHGTHCAGTVAGATFGVAKGSAVVTVQVPTAPHPSATPIPRSAGTCTFPHGPLPPG